jgi:ribosomal protein S18 acetylase RimI-like enzyme
MSAEPAVRAAGRGDLDVLVPLVVDYLDFYGVERDAADVRGYLAARLEAAQVAAFVAEGEDGRVLGMAIAHPGWDTLELAPRWLLHDLYVPPSERRRGVGRALVRAVLATARAAGAAGVSLETAHDNVTAQALYDAEGFEHDVVYRSYHHGLDRDAADGASDG